MIEVEVLYADLTRQVASLDKVDTLPKGEVLAIVVQTDQETGKKKNIAMTFGFDKYALCLKQDAGQQHVMLVGWDDNDFKWRRVSNPHDIDALREVPMPLGCLHVIFQGQQIPDAQWLKAVEVLDKEIL
jgi:hypothetical protein